METPDRPATGLWIAAVLVVIGALAVAFSDELNGKSGKTPAPQPAPSPIQPYNPMPPGPWIPEPGPNPEPRPRPCPDPGPCPRLAGGRSVPTISLNAFAGSCPCCDGECKAHPGRDCGCGGKCDCDGCLCLLTGATVGGREDRLQCDLPTDLHQKNTGGSDGAGLCVFASLRHTGLWQNDPVFAGLFDWMKRHPGGGYPEKVDKMIEQFCREKSLPKPNYIQVEGLDLPLLKLACATGRMPGITYNHSPSGRYSGQRISHMVSLPACADWGAAILDNNFPGTYEYLTPEEFKGVDPSWAVILLNAPPPSPPTNH